MIDLMLPAHFWHILYYIKYKELAANEAVL